MREQGAWQDPHQQRAWRDQQERPGGGRGWRRD
jgi:hypothetical protein